MSNPKRDTVSMELLIFVLAVLLILTFFQKVNLESDVEELAAQVEELESALAYAEDPENECEYCGSHDYTFVFCAQCDTHFPEIFALSDGGDRFCPLCYRREFTAALSSDYGKCARCNQFYERKWGAGYGLCETCGSDQLDECEFCWEQSYTVYISGNYICLRCLGNVVRDMNLGEYLELWRES